MNLKGFINRKKYVKTLLYSRCVDTPLSVFIDVLVNENLKALIKSGEPTESEIKEAWGDLFSEYCEKSSTSQYRQFFNLQKRIGILQSKILAVEMAIQAISDADVPVCVEILRRNGFNYDFDRANTEKFQSDIQSCKTRIKSSEIELKQAIKEFEGMATGDTKQKPTEKWFNECLIYLSKWIGYRLQKETVSVEEFVNIRRLYDLEIEKLQELKHRTKGK